MIHISSRGFIKSLSILVLIGLLGGAGYYFLNTNEGKALLAKYLPSNTTSKHTVYSLQGTVSRLSVGETNANPLTLTGVIHEGDTIITGNSSTVTIAFSDASLLRVGPKTTLTIQQAGEGKIGARVLSGSAWVRVLAKADKQVFTLFSTDTLNATVLGTSVALEKLPLLTKYTVLDSSETDAMKQGIDVLNASGITTHVLPGNQFVEDVLNGMKTQELDIARFYASNPDILRFTQEDVLYMNDLLKTASGAELIDAEKITRELQSTLPSIGTPEFAIFFSGADTTSLGKSMDDVMGKISLALTNQEGEYKKFLEQKDIYIDKVMEEQQKMYDGIMKDTQAFLEQNRVFVENTLREQEQLYIDITKDTQAFLDETLRETNDMVNDSMNMASGMVNDISGMTNGIIDNTMDQVGESMNMESMNINSQSIMTDSVESFDNDSTMDQGSMQMGNASMDQGSMQMGNASMDQGSMQMGNASMDQGSMQMGNASMDQGSMQMGNASMDQGSMQMGEGMMQQ